MTIEKVECLVLRAPIATPVTAAFGSMKDRPALLVRVSAADGAWGWGEVFCNFPQVGAEHRARLIDSLVAPLVVGRPSDDPGALWRELQARLRRMALQSGEPGSFAQTAAAIDQALWDMAGRRAGLPVWRLLDPAPGADGSARLYASGLGPTRVGEMALAKRAEGHTAFKFKVGFGSATDVANFREIREALGPDATVMVDANQAWDPATAAERIAELAPYAPAWIEEPLAADESLADWKRLADECGIPLAAGENLRGEAEFAAHIANGHLRYVQPDVAKWGGVTGCLAVAQRAQAAGLTYCPHWLGGGVGLAASLHVRAALGLEGYVEVDANPNPLRDEVFAPLLMSEGRVQLGELPGWGVELEMGGLEGYRVRY